MTARLPLSSYHFRDRPAPEPIEALDTRPASQWCRAGTSRDLFRSFWREGEVAVLFGEKSIGKSVLAVQIAESLARGLPLGDELEQPRPAKPTRVIYFDHRLSASQWAERYSRPLIGSETRIRHPFSLRFLRSTIADVSDIPDVFRGSMHKYVRESHGSVVECTGSKVVIFDDLNFLVRDPGSAAECARVIKGLRHFAEQSEVSILVIAGPPPARNAGGRRTGAWVAPRLVEMADSSFVLAASSFADDLRYLKQLSSPRPIEFGEESVLTLRLGRFVPELGRATRRMEMLAEFAEEPPFLGFEILGTTPEAEHLRDHAAEFALEERRRRIRELAARGLRTSEIQAILGADPPHTRQFATAADALFQGLADGSYTRYLKGE